ncbi:hypothetical protein PS880_04477 [Pseudomonas fluorescens]|uniref:Uncharacterized protein n=1 Tax=Pseudomonas fluorescens TaxID=294 RepID=A0A5E7NB55_PSEFL|nr:hypothetical protein PS880_04477 [Pseudomonas fluorescens]
MKKSNSPFAPTISLWQHSVTMVGIGGSVFVWPSPWGILILLGAVVGGAVVEGVFHAFESRSLAE